MLKAPDDVGVDGGGLGVGGRWVELRLVLRMRLLVVVLLLLLLLLKS